jgi:hypothetical protein
VMMLRRFTLSDPADLCGSRAALSNLGRANYYSVP